MPLVVLCLTSALALFANHVRRPVQAASISQMLGCCRVFERHFFPAVDDIWRLRTAGDLCRGTASNGLLSTSCVQIFALAPWGSQTHWHDSAASNLFPLGACDDQPHFPRSRLLGVPSSSIVFHRLSHQLAIIMVFSQKSLTRCLEHLLSSKANFCTFRLASSNENLHTDSGPPPFGPPLASQQVHYHEFTM
ncbi:hypothetical protein EXIGLDRAFT_370560 [Exidia glandulosa HHB12029]|uniref:Secreted protein n=1 Tax=Exidia glandulosa HHB12029 TaxID=1314781 RepID=A0A165C1M3_EXIGL|nr:hypothetical protein EXIGLDRAFT_370560 [Exidia glandulosa HHB12029]